MVQIIKYKYNINDSHNVWHIINYWYGNKFNRNL